MLKLFQTSFVLDFLDEEHRLLVELVHLDPVLVVSQQPPEIEELQPVQLGTEDQVRPSHPWTTQKGGENTQTS
jgi:hypothetical protein